MYADTGTTGPVQSLGPIKDALARLCRRRRGHRTVLSAAPTAPAGTIYYSGYLSDGLSDGHGS